MRFRKCVKLTVVCLHYLQIKFQDAQDNHLLSVECVVCECTGKIFRLQNRIDYNLVGFDG